MRRRRRRMGAILSNQPFCPKLIIKTISFAKHRFAQISPSQMASHAQGTWKIGTSNPFFFGVFHRTRILTSSRIVNKNSPPPPPPSSIEKPCEIKWSHRSNFVIHTFAVANKGEKKTHFFLIGFIKYMRRRKRATLNILTLKYARRFSTSRQEHYVYALNSDANASCVPSRTVTRGMVAAATK